MTQEKIKQIFKIICQTKEEKRVAAVKKSDLQPELIKRESNVQIAASIAAAITAVTAAIQSLKKMEIEKNNIIGEFFFKVTNISLCFAGLPKEKVV